ncbi:MAG: DUF3987 domain-containing protein [Deltaproteobacteria bacterium]|nr:DUF3987 domain-containing protein [Deltaproteobacteria bacterium]MBW2069016.1 DUF3987 domain-containing protein [Deltaproteobacteria bacterium]
MNIIEMQKKTPLAKGDKLAKKEPHLENTENRVVSPEKISQHIAKIAKEGELKYSKLEDDFEIEDFPEPDPEVFHGLAGEFVKIFEPYTEAHPMALLSHFLVFVGNNIGKGVYVYADGARHYANLFVVNVGPTARARKGTALARVRNFYKIVDQKWLYSCVCSGLSSGEGIIEAVRDPMDDEEEPVDKRLLVIESEFGSVLRILRREGNTLSPVLRDAWDGKEVLQTLTRKDNRIRATNAHISIVGHITQAELLNYLDRVEIFNGLGNRFLWVCVRRSKLLPHGGDPPTNEVNRLAQKVRRTIDMAKTPRRVEFSEDALEAWGDIYYSLAQSNYPGLLGALLDRAEAQILRLALLYAVLDQSSVINAEHLFSARAFWKYSEASARFVFGETYTDEITERLLSALKKAAQDGLTFTEVYKNIFQCNVNQKRIKHAVKELMQAGIVKRVVEKRPVGRPVQRLFLSSYYVKNVKT